MKSFILSIATICFFGICRAADDTNYTISPYNNDRDHAGAFALISCYPNEVLCTQPGNSLSGLSESEKFKIERFRKQVEPIRLHAILQNNVHMNLFFKPAEKKFFRIVLRNQHKIVGIADFYENAIEHDAVKKHDGYCERLLVKGGHATQYQLFIAAVLKQCKELGLSRLMRHLIKSETLSESPDYKAMTAAGFAEQKQTDFEKQYNIVRLEKALQS